MSRPDRIESYRDLKVWQRGLNLAERLYKLTESFPAEEKFGLTGQLRRAAVSVYPISQKDGAGIRREHLSVFSKSRTARWQKLLALIRSMEKRSP